MGLPIAQDLGDGVGPQGRCGQRVRSRGAESVNDERETSPPNIGIDVACHVDDLADHQLHERDV
jgi:hypothetical protein